jgi:hypothetical protein
MNEIMTFIGKCMKLVIIILSEISQSHEDKYHIFSHLWINKRINKWIINSGHESKSGTIKVVEGEGRGKDK